IAAAGLPEVTLEASDFELFRGRLGRRTRDEVAALGWSADPAPYLDIFFIFGPTDHPVGA
ncbi:MAG: maleylpyruvate isomerase family mycothiol-dependent enzyme, partial [Ilumatobacteraceae bacterium]